MIAKTIEENRSMKVSRRKTAIGKKDLIRVKNKNETSRPAPMKVLKQGSGQNQDITEEETNTPNKMRNNKALGTDDLVTELMKSLQENQLTKHSVYSLTNVFMR